MINIILKPNIFSVDRYACPYCWVIPTLMYTSWVHNAGEMRLHLEGPEPVKHRSLAAHYKDRWQDFWRVKCPQVSKEQFRKDGDSYSGTQQAKKYRTAGEGEAATNLEEQRALGTWRDLRRPRREHYNPDGNQILPHGYFHH